MNNILNNNRINSSFLCDINITSMNKNIDIQCFYNLIKKYIVHKVIHI